MDTPKHTVRISNFQELVSMSADKEFWREYVLVLVHVHSIRRSTHTK